MDNFNVFDKAQLAAALEPYAAGISEHVTPIKYEAITPDIFAFLFRTTGRDNTSHFFVLLQYDYMADFNEVKQTITKWHGPILEFWAPQGRNPADFDSEWSYLERQFSKTYRTVLALVEKPKAGFWGNNIFFRLGDSLEESLKDLTPQQLAAAKKTTDALMESKPDLKGKHISLYFREDGRTELFYN